MKLAKYISDLLFENDKVIIPGLGAFIGTAQPAKINNDGQSLSPPKKVITFDIHIKKADNVLARHISKSENITQIAAKKIIDDFVIDTLRELKEGKRVRLANIGVFTTDNKGNIIFDEEGNVNYLTDSFGMNPIKTSVHKENESKSDDTKEVKAEKTAPKTVKKDKVQPEVIASKEFENDKKKISVFVWILIVLFPIIVFLLTLWIVNPEYFDKQSNKIGKQIVRIKESVFPSHSGTIEADSIDKKSLNNDTLNTTSSNTDSLSGHEESDTSNTFTVKNESDKPDVTTQIESDKPSSDNDQLTFNFYLIAGSFKDKSNANKLVTQLQKKGYDSKIIGLSERGLNMVCFNGWNTREEAQKELHRIKVEDNADSWIYVIK